MKSNTKQTLSLKQKWQLIKTTVISSIFNNGWRKLNSVKDFEKDNSFNEFDNRVSKNIHIMKNKQKTFTNDTDSHSLGFENFEVIKTEEDAKIFVETMENIPEPNDKLKKAFRDFSKQETLEKYSERFNNKENEVVDGIFNPENWGRRVVKQETLEEAKVNNLIKLFGKDYDLEPRCVIESCNDSLIYGVEWQQEKYEEDLDAHLDVAKTLWLQVVKENKKMYSKKEVLEIIDSLFHQYASSFRIDAKEYFLQFKKK